MTSREKPKAMGADLVIPLLSIAFTLYYFSTVWDLNWEAKADGLAIGWTLLVLVAIFLLRVGSRVVRGEATLGMERLVQPAGAQRQRLALVAAVVLFILVIPHLGFTLTIFLFMAAALLILRVRRLRLLLGVPSAVALGGYLLFMVLLETRFPRGPIERLLAGMF